MSHAYQFGRDQMVNSVSLKFRPREFNSFLVKVKGVEVSVWCHAPDKAVRQ
jgi:hypothetical protein